jgi:hypothetical protein
MKPPFLPWTETVVRTHRRCALWLVFAIAGFAAVLPGCGTAEYRRLMADRGDKVRTSAAFRTLFGPSQIGETPIKIRVPMAFGKSYVETSAHPQDGPKINAERLQPPFLPLPGFKLCYEGTGQDPQLGKVPFYCYLAAVPARAGDADKLATELQTQLKEKFKDAPDAWDVTDAAAPDGKSLQWKKIRVVGDQPFLVRVADKTVSQNLPGIFELWLCNGPDYIVLVGWRTPTSVEGPTPPPADDAPLIPNPLAPLQDAKPDFKTMPVLTAGTLTFDAPAPGDAPAN